MSVNPRLTAKRTRELEEYEPMVRRVIAAHGRRVAAMDPEDLAGVVGLHDAVDQAIEAAVQGQRRNGFSWSDIGRGLGTTRQNAHQRFATGTGEP